MTVVEMANNLAPEVKEQALKCKTTDEIIALMKANSIDLSQEQAEEILKLSKGGELSDDELEAVAGGVSFFIGISACAVAWSVSACAGDVCAAAIGS